jgi:hypothetical protein
MTKIMLPKNAKTESDLKGAIMMWNPVAQLKFSLAILLSLYD